MKHLTLKLSLVLLCFSVLFTSCGSDDNEVKEEQSQSIENPEKFLQENFNSTLEKFKLPESITNSSDENAVFLSSLAESNRSLISAFSGFFIIPENAVSTSAKSIENIQAVDERFTWSDGSGNSIVYTINETADRLNVKYIFTFEGNTTTLYEGFVTKDGKKGQLIFNSSQEEQKITFNWEVTENSLLYNITTFDSELKFKINDNGTGSLGIFEEGIKTSEYLWSADGSGSITDFITDETFTWKAS